MHILIRILILRDMLYAQAICHTAVIEKKNDKMFYNVIIIY